MKRITSALAAFAFALTTTGTASAADLDMVAPDVPFELSPSVLFEAWVGYTFITDRNGIAENQDYQDYPSFAFHLRGSLPLGNMWSLQGDFDFEFTDKIDLPTGTGPDVHRYSGQVGGHLSKRDPDRGLFGVFGAFGRTSKCRQGSLNQGRNFCDHDFFAVGGEGQAYLEDLTLYIQGGYLDSSSVTPSLDEGAGKLDGLHDAWFVRGVGRWFPTSHSRAQLEVAYANGSQDAPDTDNMEVIEWAGRYDATIEGLPVFAGYRGTYYDNTVPGRGDTGSYIDHTIFVGFAFLFGPENGLALDRTGATLDLPSFGRWVAAGDILD